MGDAYGGWANLTAYTATSDTFYYDVTANGIASSTITISSPSAEPDEPEEEGALDWLDRRVEEMRVKL